MNGPKYGGVKRFIADVLENIARGRDMWESPEWTLPADWTWPYEEIAEGKGRGREGNQEQWPREQWTKR